MKRFVYFEIRETFCRLIVHRRYCNFEVRANVRLKTYFTRRGTKRKIKDVVVATQFVIVVVVVGR